MTKIRIIITYMAFKSIFQTPRQITQVEKNTQSRANQNQWHSEDQAGFKKKNLMKTAYVPSVQHHHNKQTKVKNTTKEVHEV